MTKPRSHLLDVYDCWLHLATNETEWATLCKQHDGALDDEPNSGGITQMFVDTEDHHRPHVAIYLDPTVVKDGGRWLIDTLTHEATHVAAQLLDHIGQKADRHDSEALAYLAGWVAGWMWESL